MGIFELAMDPSRKPIQTPNVLQPIYISTNSSRAVKPESTEAFATRLPGTEAAKIEQVIDDTSWTRADFVRRAIRYYMAKNPDHITALPPTNSLEEFVTELTE